MISMETNTMKMQHFIHAVIVSCKIVDLYITLFKLNNISDTHASSRVVTTM